MRNFIAPGSRVTITAGSDIQSGDGVLQGALFGVAGADIASGDEGEIMVEGVFELPKAGSQAWTVGARVYWDNGNSRCTTAASGNTLIGVAYDAVGSGADETSGRVRLNGAAV